MISALVVFCIIAAASAQGRPAYICEVLLDNFCPTNAATCANDPVLNFGSADYGFENFNLVSFGGMYAPSGDVEGRTAVRNSVDLTAYSIGYQLRTAGVAANSPSLPYTMVVGRDAKWHGGSVHPDGSGFPYAGPKEYIFVGGDFTQSDSYLQNDRTGSCPTTGCLDSYFDYAQGYYKDLSAGFAALANNVNVNVQPWGTIEVTCDSLATATYVFTISPNTFSTLTFWQFDANTCNPASSLVVNIIGAGSQVKFQGATQTFFQNQRVLYNVVPTASTPSVRVEVGVNGNLLAPDSQYNQPGMGVFIGQVIVANVVQVHQINLIYCAPPPSPNPNNSTNPLCPAWETDCAGLDLVFGGQTYSFRDMNAISFGSFVADTGDIEGRLAVQHDCTFGLGYSVGYELKTANGIPDRSLPYSLVCGGNGNWGSGSLHPDGTGIPYPGAKEDAFIGGSFTSTQQDLIDRVTGTCGTSGCLDATFEAAKTCYTGYSTSIGAAADNVQHTISDSALNVVCNDASASEYWISIDGSDFASFTYVVTSSCNFQAKWYINIRGSGDFTISGGSWPGVPGGIVYNVIGCDRTVTVKETALGGHLLAPCSTVYQPSGVITGKVVAGDITASLQINRENTCPNQVTVQVPVVVASLTNGNEADFTSNFLVNGDVVDGKTVVANRGDNAYAFSDKISSWTKGQVFTVSADTHTSRTPNPVESGAAAVAVSVALVAFVALAF